MTSSLLADSLIVLILALMAGHAVYVNNKRGWLAFDPLNAFWAGAVVIYVLQPIEFGSILVRWYGVEVLEETLVWVIFGLVFVIIGYESKLGVGWSRRIPAVPESLNPNKLFIAGMALTALGTLSYAAIIAAAGGLDEWASIGRAKAAARLVSGYVGTLQVLVPAGLGLMLFHVEMHRAPPLRRLLIWAASFFLLLFFFYIGSRSRLIGFTVLMLTAYYLPRRINPPISLISLLFVVLLVTSTLMGLYRDQFQNFEVNLSSEDIGTAIEHTLPSITGNSSTLERIQVSRGIEFSCTLAAVDLVPDDVPYNYGYSQLEFVTRFIPRAIWPDKMYPHYEAFTPIYAKAGLSDKWVPNVSRPILQGPAFGYIGHWYAVGGGVALVIAGILTGALYRTLREWFTTHWGEGHILIYSSMIIIGFNDAVATPFFWLFNLPFVIGGVYITTKLCAEKPPIRQPA